MQNGRTVQWILMMNSFPAALSKWTTNRAGRLMAKWALAALSVRAILISNYLT